MEYSETADGKVKIKGFTPILSEKKLVNIGNKWYAADSDGDMPVPLAEELSAINSRTIPLRLMWASWGVGCFCKLF